MTLQMPIVSTEWQQNAFQRLDRAHQMARVLPFDNGSRLVFFSDLHRGTGGPDDSFAANQTLFLRVMESYYQQDFTYIEVGDGDELWQNGSFEEIRFAHAPIFELLHAMHQDDRLHLIVGNHDSQQGLFDPVVKDGLPVYQSILLQHAQTEQQLLAVHGHQADRLGDRYWSLSRINARYFWKYLLRMGLESWQHFDPPDLAFEQPSNLRHVPDWLSQRILKQPRKIAACLQAWASIKQQLIICGHTHLPAFARSMLRPYFNTGCCTSPGFLTGLELLNGNIQMILWESTSMGAERHVLAQAPLSAFQS